MLRLSPKIMLIGAASLSLGGLALMLFGRSKPATSMSAKGLRKLAQDEGRMRKLYNDPLGHCTVGVGHLVHRGNCNGSEEPAFLQGGLPPAGVNTRAPSNTLTDAEMMALFKEDVGQRERLLAARTTVPLSQPQFDAVVSYIYNVGGYGSRATAVYAAINAGDFDEAARLIERGTNQALLAGRRAEEAAMFRSGAILA